MEEQKRDKEPVVRLVSAGGVVYRTDKGRVEVVICGRRDPERWSLPKGTPNPGETLEQTALREVREETGLDVAMQDPLGSINYWFVRPEDKARRNKTVYFYLMTCEGGSVDRHDPEFDEVRWVPAEQASQLLAFANEVTVLQRALERIAKREEKTV